MAAKMEVNKFDGKGDFGVWKLKMRGLLSFHQVLISLEEDLAKWTDEQQKRKAQIRSDAYYLIILSLSDNVIRKVSKTKDPIELWNKLESLYGNILAPNLAYLKSSLYAFKLDTTKTVDDNLDDFLKLIELLDSTEHAVDETSQVMILMNALPDSFLVVKNAFQYSGTVPSLDLFCTALRTRENEIKQSKSKSGSSLYIKNKGKNKNKKDNKAEAKDRQPGNKVDQENKTGLEKRKCFFCKKTGHLKRDCYKWLNKNRDKVENNLVAGKNADACEVLNVTDRKVSNEWVLDSGCSYHMSPNFA